MSVAGGPAVVGGRGAVKAVKRQLEPEGRGGPAEGGVTQQRGARVLGI